MPLKLLSIKGNENFDTFFDDNNFTEKLKSKIRENKVFPTIANQYISIENQPVFYKNNYAEILPQDKFPDLMLYSTNSEINEMIEWLDINDSYEKEYLFQSITDISNQLNIENRAKLISY